MAKFNFYDYLLLPENKVLRIKLANSEESILVSHVSQRVLQGYQPAFTPIKKITLKVIKDLEVYRRDKDDDENFNDIEVDPEEVDQFELVEI